MLRPISVVWLCCLCGVALSLATHAELYLFRLAIGAHGRPVPALDTELMSLVLVVVVGPVLEEIVFRWGLIGLLRKRLPAFAAIVISSVVFAASHSQYASFNAASTSAMSTIFTAGIALGYIYFCARTLIAPVVTHITYNALTFLPVEHLYRLEEFSPAIVLAVSLLLAAIGGVGIALAGRNLANTRPVVAEAADV